MLYIKEKEKKQRGRSSVGRAPALQAGGQEFESLHLHSKFCKNFESFRKADAICTLKTSYRKEILNKINILIKTSEK